MYKAIYDSSGDPSTGTPPLKKGGELIICHIVTLKVLQRHVDSTMHDHQGVDGMTEELKCCSNMLFEY